MGKIQKEIPAKLICGLIYSNEEISKDAKMSLERKLGKIDFESKVLDFNFTDYYENELGKDLKRQFISFQGLISPSKLSSIKRFTNKLEKRFSKNGHRMVNIDPGYLNGSKLVLATTKDFSHRVYLSKGIFAEVTLSYRGNSFTSWEWTYPDYKTEAYREIFNRIRLNYLKQIK